MSSQYWDLELGIIFVGILSLPVSLSPEFQNQDSAMTLFYGQSENKFPGIYSWF